MTPTDMLRVQTLARAFEDAMAANPLATFAQADQSPIGSVNEASWTNASGHLFDLAQVGRLYQDARP
jgi:hypothetical protein